MVKLRAFDVNEFCCFWVTVWIGDSLRDLSKEDFAFFKNVYNISNLSLSFSYFADDDDEYKYPAFDEMPF